MKYEQLCNDILKVITKDNIQDVFHCVTRLRFIVKDKSKINVNELEEIKGVMQVKEVGNQIQLVIGSHVQEVYENFCAISGFKVNAEVAADADDLPKEKVSIGAKILDTLSSIFLPVMPVLVAGGMLKSLVMILTTFNIIAGDNGIIVVLSAIGDAPFYFLPFMVGLTTAKHFKLNEAYGLMIAGILLYPTFLNQTAGTTITFGFFSIPAYSYASSVLPAILSVIAFSYIYKFVDKFIPSNLKIVLSGLISFAIFMPILLAVVAPLGNYLGILLGSSTQFLFNTTGPIAGALFAGLMSFIVMAGMHSSLFPIMLQNLSTLGYSFLFPAFFINNLAVAGSTLGASFKIKDPEMKSAAISSGSLGILGITEPALYTVDIKYKQPLIGIIAGGAVGGILYMLFSVKCYAFVLPGIFSLPAYIDDANNIVFMIISLVAAFIVSFAYSYIMTKDNG